MLMMMMEMTAMMMILLTITEWKGECFSTTGGIRRKRRRFRENIVLLSRLSKENEFCETLHKHYSRVVWIFNLFT